MFMLLVSVAPYLLDDPYINVSINVPMGLALVFGAAFVVYAIKSLL